jgi:hypothetical protein
MNKDSSPGHQWYLEQLVYDWNKDLVALLKGVPEEMRALVGSVDADEAYDDLLTMLRKGKGPRREVVQKNPRLADKLEAVEADIWSEVDFRELDGLHQTDAKVVRRNLRSALSKALVQTGLVGKNLRRAYAMDRNIRNDIDLVALRLKRMGLPYVAKEFQAQPFTTLRSWKPLVEDAKYMGQTDNRGMHEALRLLTDFSLRAKDQGHRLKPVRFSTAARRVAARHRENRSLPGWQGNVRKIPGKHGWVIYRMEFRDGGWLGSDNLRWISADGGGPFGGRGGYIPTPFKSKAKLKAVIDKMIEERFGR